MISDQDLEELEDDLSTLHDYDPPPPITIAILAYLSGVLSGIAISFALSACQLIP